MMLIRIVLLGALLAAAACSHQHPKLSGPKRSFPMADGTKLEMEGLDVYVVDKKGHREPAPDGTHITTDGKVLATRDGQLVTM